MGVNTELKPSRLYELIIANKDLIELQGYKIEKLKSRVEKLEKAKKSFWHLTKKTNSA